MQTVFANVLNIRLTQAELVLEVGSFFPDRVPVGIAVGPPSDYKPEIRIVLNKAVLPNIVKALTQAAEAAAKAQAEQAATPSAEQAKRPVGFSGS